MQTQRSLVKMAEEGNAVENLVDDMRRKPPRLNRNQVRSFWAAWAGWTMDGMDSFIYSLVLVPALRDLLPKSGIAASPANVGYYGGLLFAVFMIGWGTALIWGPIADRFGRVRTMMVSIAWFSFFTLLSAFAAGVWSLAILRFLAGVGIGGEWSVGAALVAEEWPEERRTKGGAWMHTGYYVGFFLAAAANYFIGSRFGWRYMFVVGGLPALLVGVIRNNVREPERWATKLEDLGKQWKMHHAFLELFSRRYRRRTVFNSIYLIVSLAGLWAAAVYVPAAMTYIATRTGHTAMDAAKLASYSTALLGIATVLGALIVPWLARTGRSQFRGLLILAARTVRNRMPRQCVCLYHQYWPLCRGRVHLSGRCRHSPFSNHGYAGRAHRLGLHHRDCAVAFRRRDQG